MKNTLKIGFLAIMFAFVFVACKPKTEEATEEVATEEVADEEAATEEVATEEVASEMVDTAAVVAE